MSRIVPVFDTEKPEVIPTHEDLLHSSEEDETRPKDQSAFAEVMRLRAKAKKRVEHTASTVEGKGQESVLFLNTPKKYVVSPPQTNSTMAGKRDLKRKWLIRTTHPFRIKWDLFVICLAIWNCFMTPYMLVFDPTLNDNSTIITVSTVLDVLFFIDVLLTFRTTYFSSITGDEIFDTAIISKNYLLGKFWIDLISCFPNSMLNIFYPDSSLDSMSSGKAFAVLGVLKLYRISRLNRIINNMRAKDNVKLALRIGQLMFFLIMYLHLVACAFRIMIAYDESWLPANEDLSLMYEGDKSYQYWMCFYASVQLLIGGEMAPRTGLQASFCGIMILCGAFITACLFGNMAVLMDNLNMRQTKFQESHNIVNTAMKNMRLPDELQQRISDYLIYTQETMASSEEFATFSALVSPSLYNEVLQFLYGALIKDSEVFGGVDEIKTFIIPKLRPQFCKPEEMLITQGEEGERMCLYFLARGSCQILVKNECQVEKSVGVIHPATHFGEVALILNSPRTASVRSLNYSTLAVLQKDDFLQLISSFPACVSVFKRSMYHYTDPYKKFLLRMLRRVSCFKGLSTITEQELLYNLKLVRVEDGEYIARPGQTSEVMYFLSEGTVEASFTINDKDLHTRRTSMYHLHKNGSRRKSSMDSDFRSAIETATALKITTDIYPLLGPTGIEGSVHVTELDSNAQHLLGKHCVELVLDVLGPGSPIGCFTTISADNFALQVKALGKCACYTLSKQDLSRLRKSRSDLHHQLLEYEKWAKENTPLVDDYILANDLERGLQFKMNEHRNRYRLRGAVLRVIRENRDRRLVDTPLLALMLKTMKLDPRSKLRKPRSNNLQSITKTLLQKIFDPKFRQKLVKQQNMTEVTNQVSGLAHKLVGQQENLQGRF